MGAPHEESINNIGRLKIEALNPRYCPRQMKELHNVIERGVIRRPPPSAAWRSVSRVEASKPCYRMPYVGHCHSAGTRACRRDPASVL